MLHIKKIRPLRTNILVTGECFEKDYLEEGIIQFKAGDLKPWQKVLAVGEEVNKECESVNVGDMVMIDLSRYAVKKYDKNSLQNDLGNNKIIEYIIPWVQTENDLGESVNHLLISRSDISYVFEGYEKDEPQIEIVQKNIII